MPRGRFRLRVPLVLIGLVASTCIAGGGVAVAGVGVWGPSNGPLGGDVSALAVDPRNPRTIYAGAESGAGVFKSTDGGRSWRAVNSGFAGSYATHVHALAIDPETPGIVYAGAR